MYLLMLLDQGALAALCRVNVVDVEESILAAHEKVQMALDAVNTQPQALTNKSHSIKTSNVSQTKLLHHESQYNELTF